MEHTKQLSFHNVFPLFKNNNFLKLWGAQICGQTGVNMLHFVLIVQVFQRTQNIFFVGILIAVLSIPSILFSPIAGTLADSFNRRNILVVINLIRLALTVLVIATVELPGIWLLLAFLVTAASQFFIPTEQASIPEVVPSHHLMTANSFFTFSMYGTFFLGFSGAGPLLEYAGEFSTLVIISLLFLVAFGLNYLLPQLDRHIQGKSELLRDRLHPSYIWRSALDGFKYIGSQRVLFVIIIQVAFIFAVERAVIALVPALAQNIFHLSVAEISFFMITPLALGTVFGVFVVNYFKSRKTLTQIMRFGLVVDAITLLLLPLYLEFASVIELFTGTFFGGVVFMRLYVVVISLISGIADVLIVVSVQTFIQQQVHATRRGRTFASMMMAMNAAGIPLVLVISLLADIINPTVVLVVFGIATWLLVFWGLWFLKRNKDVVSLVK